MHLRIALPLAVLSLLPSALGQLPWKDHLLFGGSFMKGVGLGDADGDGHDDLFVVMQSTGTLRFLRGLGDGSFDGIPLPVTTGVRGFAVADVNGDGLADVVTYGFEEHAARIQLAIGGGAYGPPASVPTSGIGASLELDDLDGDGQLDLAVGLVDVDRVSLALGAGDGSFGAVADAVVPSGHRFVHTGDLNGDDLTDLVTWREGPSGDSVAVEFGLGSASFDAPLVLFEDWIDDLAVGDLDGDGADDLALIGLTNHLIHGAVGGVPGLPQPVAFGAFDDELARIADVNDDGRLDLISAGDQVLGVNLQLEAGGFGPQADVIYSGTAAGIDLLELADIDRDGRLDAVAAGAGNFLSILVGQGDGGFRPVYASPQPGYLVDVLPVDFDLDGRLDLLAGTVATSSDVHWMRKGGPDASFAPPTAVSLGVDAMSYDAFALDADDVTGDGIPDVLAMGAGPDGGPARVSVTAGHGDLTFAAPVVTVVASSGARADFTDFNADGLTDAVLVGKTTGGQAQLSMLALQAGSFVLDSSLTFPLGAGGIRHVVAEDIDENGATDVLIMCHTPMIVQVLLALPGGGFVGPTTLPGVTDTTSIALQDMDQDGHVDLISSQSFTDALHVRAGHGDGSFGPPDVYPTSDGAGAPLVADVDDDGLTDVVLFTFGSSSYDLSLFTGLPGGGLFFAGAQPVSAIPFALRLADIDRDGRNDLVMVHGIYDESQVVIFPNRNGPWKNRTHSLAGSAGFSKLVGEGSLQPGSPPAFHVSHGPALAPVFFVVGLAALDAPFKGGTMVPQPLLVLPLGSTDADGARQVSTTWPQGFPHGATIFVQAWFVDAGGPAHFAATNGVSGTAP